VAFFLEGRGPPVPSGSLRWGLPCEAPLVRSLPSFGNVILLEGGTVGLRKEVHTMARAMGARKKVHTEVRAKSPGSDESPRKASPGALKVALLDPSS
jgi:hypothetical protein